MTSHIILVSLIPLAAPRARVTTGALPPRFAVAGPFLSSVPQADAPTLTDANIRLGMGSRCALLGKNGAGKTTLMRILVGELQCDEDKGTVWVHHNLRLAYVAQVRAASVISFH